MKLQDDEKLIDKWNTNFSYNGSSYNVDLYVSDKNVYVDAKFAMGGLADAEGVLKFSKNEISNIEAFTSMFIFHRVKIKLNNGTEYTIDRGLMPTSGIVKALKS